MCGIFGFIGQKKNAGQLVFDGLKRLDYRGHDSWGIALINDGKIAVEKGIGEISGIGKDKKFSESNIGIGHTRWATTGKVSLANAHPHLSTDRSFALAQNGIVENFEDLKKELVKKGYLFKSETDTEVIVRLIEDEFKKNKNLFLSIKNTFLKLKGRNTIIVLDLKSKTIFAVRNGSPLVVGINNKNEKFISSDSFSLSSYVNKIITIENNQIIAIDPKEIKIFNLETLEEIGNNFEKINFKNPELDKNGYEHFLIKEIHEAPFAICQIAKNFETEKYVEFADAIKKARQVYVIGSGTAGVSAAQTAFYLRSFGKIVAVSLVGADASEYFSLFDKRDLIIALSQSGETADVLEVLEIAKSKGVKIASFVNMPGSMITRMSDYKFMANAGPEISVMSTKIFVSQITWGYLLSKIIQGKTSEGLKNLDILSKQSEKYLNNQKNIIAIQKIVKKLVHAKDIFILGKSENFQIAKEGMVKMIEGTYKHAHAIPAGDLKHYAITLIEEGVFVFAIFSKDQINSGLINSINEVKSRGGQIIGISPENNKSFDFYLNVPDTGETSAIINILPLQLFAYYMAVALGNNVDKPRNIAKSVTVK